VSSYNLATSVAMTLFHWGGTGGPKGPGQEPPSTACSPGRRLSAT
jgi:hypothetical protein